MEDKRDFNENRKNILVIDFYDYNQIIIFCLFHFVHYIII